MQEQKSATGRIRIQDPTEALKKRHAYEVAQLTERVAQLTERCATLERELDARDAPLAILAQLRTLDIGRICEQVEQFNADVEHVIEKVSRFSDGLERIERATDSMCFPTRDTCSEPTLQEYEAEELPAMIDFVAPELEPVPAASPEPAVDLAASSIAAWE